MSWRSVPYGLRFFSHLLQGLTILSAAQPFLTVPADGLYKWPEGVIGRPDEAATVEGEQMAGQVGVVASWGEVFTR